MEPPIIDLQSDHFFMGEGCARPPAPSRPRKLRLAPSSSVKAA